MPLLSLSSFFFTSVLFISFAVPIVSEPHAFPSFDLGLIQKEEEKCPYTVIVSTSCHSPESTRDHISLAFGDDDGNQVYAPRLDQGETFDKCSSNTFQVKGQCANQICYAYLHRTGPDGWVPESVKIYAEDAKAVKFDFNKTNVPDNTWFGNNHCNNTGPQPPYFPPDTPSSPPSFPPHTPSPPPLFPPDTPSVPPPRPRPSSAWGLRASEHVVIGLVVAAGVAAMVV